MPADVLARHAQTLLLAIEGMQVLHMLQQHRTAHLRRCSGQRIATAQVLIHGRIKPRVALTSTTDHDRRGAGFMQYPGCLAGAVDIAIGYHRNIDAVHHFGNDGIINCALILLRARAPMHGEHVDAGLFCQTGDSHGIDVLSIGADADFQRHRHVHRQAHGC